MAETPTSILDAAKVAARKTYGESGGLRHEFDSAAKAEREAKALYDAQHERTEKARGKWGEKESTLKELTTFLEENGEHDWVRSLKRGELT